MKNLKRSPFLIVIVTIIHSLSFGQNVIAYQKALKYIRDQNVGKNMVVSDTIIHLPFHNFTGEICKLWGENNDVVSRRLDSVDQVQEDKKFVLNEFKNLKFGSKGSTQIIYFSDFYSFMVIGETLEQKNKKRGLNHDFQTGFNESTQYLFVFDKKYSLKKVLKIRIAYD